MNDFKKIQDGILTGVIAPVVGACIGFGLGLSYDIVLKKNDDVMMDGLENPYTKRNAGNLDNGES